LAFVSYYTKENKLPTYVCTYVLPYTVTPIDKSDDYITSEMFDVQTFPVSRLYYIHIVINTIALKLQIFYYYKS
jgi:hypothetical protein